MEVQSLMTDSDNPKGLPTVKVAKLKPKTHRSLESKKVAAGIILSVIMLLSSFYFYIDYHEYVHSVVCTREGGTPVRTSFISTNCTTSNQAFASYDIGNELISSILFPSFVIIFFLSLIYIITNTKRDHKVISIWD